MKKEIVIVICTGNSCRSQMCEGYLKFYSKKMNLNIEVLSAGIKAEGVKTKAITTMLEDNIDISKHTSNVIEEYISKPITHVITVCDHAYESCPVLLKKANFTHQNFKDPSKVVGDNAMIDKAFSTCREEIKKFTLTFLKTNFIND